MLISTGSRMMSERGGKEEKKFRKAEVVYITKISGEREDGQTSSFQVNPNFSK